MKKLLIALVAAMLFSLVATGPTATAGTQPLVRIGGPGKLQAARVLQFPIYCSAPCFVKVTSRLVWPGPDLVSTVSTTIQPGRPKIDRLTLNGPATAHLKANYRQSHLRVIARARNLDTNAKQNDQRTFGFKL